METCPSQNTLNSHVHTGTAKELHLSLFARNEDGCESHPNVSSPGQYTKPKYGREGAQYPFRGCRPCFKGGAHLNKVLRAIRRGSAGARQSVQRHFKWKFCLSADEMLDFEKKR